MGPVPTHSRQTPVVANQYPIPEAHGANWRYLPPPMQQQDASAGLMNPHQPLYRMSEGCIVEDPPAHYGDPMKPGGYPGSQVAAYRSRCGPQYQR